MAPFRNLPRRLTFMLLLSLSAGCADDDGDSGPFDGNFIVGDASLTDRGVVPGDLGIRDAGDVGDGELDLGVPPDDAGGEDADLAVGDDATVGPEDAGPDPCAVEPEETLTASAAVARGASLAGHVVAIEGLLGAGTPTCTDRACPRKNPCCNSCSAELWIDEVLPVSPSSCLPNVGCSGDECGLVCRPLILGSTEIFVGRIAHDSVTGNRLELIQTQPR